jgi:putative hemolysin
VVTGRSGLRLAAQPPMSDHLDPIPWLDVLLLLALIGLNGVLAMSELAIVSSR